MGITGEKRVGLGTKYGTEKNEGSQLRRVHNRRRGKKKEKAESNSEKLKEEGLSSLYLGARPPASASPAGGETRGTQKMIGQRNWTLRKKVRIFKFDGTLIEGERKKI